MYDHVFPNCYFITIYCRLRPLAEDQSYLPVDTCMKTLRFLQYLLAKSISRRGPTVFVLRETSNLERYGIQSDKSNKIKPWPNCIKMKDICIGIQLLMSKVELTSP